MLLCVPLFYLSCKVTWVRYKHHCWSQWCWLLELSGSVPVSYGSPIHNLNCEVKYVRHKTLGHNCWPVKLIVLVTKVNAQQPTCQLCESNFQFPQYSWCEQISWPAGFFCPAFNCRFMDAKLCQQWPCEISKFRPQNIFIVIGIKPISKLS